MEQNNVFVFEESKQERLDKILATQFPEYSRSYWQKMIEQGYILVNDEPSVKANEKIKSGSTIAVLAREEETLDIVAENIPLDIIYQDNDVAVINKKRGMVVHPAAGHAQGTLVNALMYHLKDLSSINGVVRPGIVHRIDKDTSGLLVVAKNDNAHVFLSEQLLDKSLYREYVALVHGDVREAEFIIDLPIGRHSLNRQQMAVVEGARDARTHVEVIERFGNYTLVRCRLETGRTHQIRVHLQYLGHPIVGDPVYTSRKNDFNLTGQFLHAYKLGFIHPTTKESMEFTAPLPNIFEQILKTLRKEVE